MSGGLTTSYHHPAAMRVASPDSAYIQTTSEMMESKVVIEMVDATIISSQ